MSADGNRILVRNVVVTSAAKSWKWASIRMMERDRTELKNLGELAKLFLRLWFLGFGGPAAHIAMMEGEVVKRRGWSSNEHLIDLLGVTNLIPGPNSTEMAIHIGLVRSGWRGLVIAGVCFIVPAFAIPILIWNFHPGWLVAGSAAIGWVAATFHF